LKKAKFCIQINVNGILLRRPRDSFFANYRAPLVATCPFVEPPNVLRADVIAAASRRLTCKPLSVSKQHSYPDRNFKSHSLLLSGYFRSPTLEKLTRTLLATIFPPHEHCTGSLFYLANTVCHFPPLFQLCVRIDGLVGAVRTTSEATRSGKRYW
jgi:hypothetical protein